MAWAHIEVIGGQVVINRLPTNYQLDPQGDPDNSYQDTESRYQLMYAARDLKVYLSSLYSRKIWVDDNTKLSGSINNAVAMPSMLKASCISRYRLPGADLGIVQDADAFAAGLVVEKRGSAAQYLLGWRPQQPAAPDRDRHLLHQDLRT